VESTDKNAHDNAVLTEVPVTTSPTNILHPICVPCAGIHTSIKPKLLKHSLAVVVYHKSGATVCFNKIKHSP